MNIPFPFSGSKMHSIDAETVGRALIRGKNKEAIRTSAEGGCKTGSNNHKIICVPVWLGSMEWR
jgi:hypothetical protein